MFVCEYKQLNKCYQCAHRIGDFCSCFFLFFFSLRLCSSYSTSASAAAGQSAQSVVREHDRYMDTDTYTHMPTDLVVVSSRAVLINQFPVRLSTPALHQLLLRIEGTAAAASRRPSVLTRCSHGHRSGGGRSSCGSGGIGGGRRGGDVRVPGGLALALRREAGAAQQYVEGEEDKRALCYPRRLEVVMWRCLWWC